MFATLAVLFCAIWGSQASDQFKTCSSSPCDLTTCGPNIGNGTCGQNCTSVPCNANCNQPQGTCLQQCPLGGCQQLKCKAMECRSSCHGSGGCNMECDALSCRPRCSRDCTMISTAGAETFANCDMGCSMECHSEQICSLRCTNGGCTLKVVKGTTAAELVCNGKPGCTIRCHDSIPAANCMADNTTTIAFYSDSSAAATLTIPNMALFLLSFHGFWLCIGQRM